MDRGGKGGGGGACIGHAAGLHSTSVKSQPELGNNQDPDGKMVRHG